MSAQTGWVSLLGRALLAAIFILAGWNKITGYDGTVQYMQAFGLPALLLPMVIALELGGGLALLAGFLARWAALALALFSLAAAVIFHSNFSDATQMSMFLKNLAITGGLLLVFAYGPGPLSVRE
ncbi:MAG: DoxX family protein [Alphaproteobacteria bacterium]|nr:DoxX family protein [Alphaproteobacteria bacterium]